MGKEGCSYLAIAMQAARNSAEKLSPNELAKVQCAMCPAKAVAKNISGQGVNWGVENDEQCIHDLDYREELGIR